jgi:preprotein translocase subunit SecG
MLSVHNNILTKATMIFACLFITAQVMQMVDAKSIRWELEDYNGWNLPFAKTVQI